MRRTMSLGWAPLAVFVLALHAGPGVALEKTKVVIGAATTGTFVSYPLALADKLGFFKAEGLDAEIVTFAGGTKAVPGLMGGTADYNVGLYEYTIRLQPQNQYLVSIFNQILYPGFAVGVRKPLADKVKTLKDLKGLKVGVTAPGSGTQTMVQYLASKEGVKLEDIAYIPVGSGGTALAALQHGEIDALSNLDPLMTAAETQGLLTVIADFRNKAGTDKYFHGSAGSLGLVARADTVERNPQTTQAVVNAMMRAVLWIRTHSPEELAKALPAEYGQNDMPLWLASYKNVIGSLAPDGLMPPDAAQNTYQYIAESTPEVRGTKIDVGRTYTNKFVEQSPVFKELRGLK